MGPWGPKMGVPPKKAPILRKMPFRVDVCLHDSYFAVPQTHILLPPHDDVVVV